MSVADHEIDEPNIVCSACGKAIGVFQIPLCGECRADLADQVGDEHLQDRLEGRRK